MNQEELANLNIILFDGVCNLCDGTVRFIAKRDSARIYKFAWAQSDKGQELLAWCKLPINHLETVVYVENGVPYYKSTAALKIVRHLAFPWPVAYFAGIIIPASIRDYVYDRISTNRYQWFGKKDECTIPDKNLISRFIWL